MRPRTPRTPTAAVDAPTAAAGGIPGIPPRALALVLSGRGVRTAKFGPAGWRFIHLTAMNYPLKPTRDQRRWYYAFFKSLCHILPCKYCRKEFCKMTQTPGDPLFLSRARFVQAPGEKPGAARVRLFLYTLELHERVNRRLSKPARPMAYYITKYADMRSVA